MLALGNFTASGFLGPIASSGNWNIKYAKDFCHAKIVDAMLFRQLSYWLLLDLVAGLFSVVMDCQVLRHNSSLALSQARSACPLQKHQKLLQLWHEASDESW